MRGLEARHRPEVVLRRVHRLPAAELQKFVDACATVLVIELSHSAQFHQFLRTKVDLPRAKTTVYARSGGRSLGVTEIIKEVAPEFEEVPA